MWRFNHDHPMALQCRRAAVVHTIKEMIDRTHDLPVMRQAQVLGLARSSVYYQPRPISAGELAIMRRLDELHLNYPFAGGRMLWG
jgi:hypothetical protein